MDARGQRGASPGTDSPQRRRRCGCGVDDWVADGDRSRESSTRSDLAARRADIGVAVLFPQPEIKPMDPAPSERV